MTTPFSTRAAPTPSPPRAAAPRLAGLIRLDPELGPISDAQLERVCADNPGWKFELSAAGELVINVYAGDESSDVGAELGRQVGNWRVGGGGGRARDASAGYRLSLADEVLQGPLLEPDLSWVSPERLARASRDDLRGAMKLTPDFVVEIRSPSDRLRDQQDKMQIWTHYGVRLGWLVDLQARHVWIYRPDQPPQRLERPSTLSGEDVLVGLVVDCTEVWHLADATDDPDDAADDTVRANGEAI